jgi:hypothetical protein
MTVMTQAERPGFAARLVVGSLATLGLVVGALVATVVAMLALLVGVPLWGIALGVLAVAGGLLAATSRVRRSARAAE